MNDLKNEDIHNITGLSHGVKYKNIYKVLRIEQSLA